MKPTKLEWEEFISFKYWFNSNPIILVLLLTINVMAIGSMVLFVCMK